MAPLDIDTVLGWHGRPVHDSSGEKIGTFGDVFLDSDTDTPAWGTVRTGLFGRHETLVPLSALQEDEDGVRVPFTGDEVKAAPRVDPDVALTPEEEDQLYAHYGMGGAGGDAAAGTSTGATAVSTEGDTTTSADRVPEDTGGAEVTRSEEEARVTPGPMRPKERVRLKKVLVTEHVQRTVPVQKEVVE